MITAKKIAQKLGLSETAVSMALNNRPGVSTETKRLIIETAEEMGYDFSRISAKRQETGDVYCIFCRTRNAILSYDPIFSELTEGIEQECSANNYRLKTVRISGSDSEIERCLEDLRVTKCDGMILVGTELTEEITRRFMTVKIPFVLLDTYFTAVDCSSVLINNTQGAYLAASYLMDTYHTQPAYLRSSFRIPNFEERRQGFVQAVRDYGFSASKTKTYDLSPSIDGAFTDMLKILDEGNNTERCYLCDNDLIAIGAIRALKLRGCRVPEDTAVMGFDNISEGRILDPSLTTIDVPRIYMGKTAFRQLYYEMKNPMPHHSSTGINVSLVKRASA